jgi:CheY-like chemotaxis protein
MARVTVVNDNPEFLELVRDILEDDRYEATPINGDRPDAVESILESRPDVLMIDLRMGSEGMHGWDVAKRVRSDDRFDQLPILLCSADVRALREMGELLNDEHRIRCVEKPFSIDQLTTTIDELLSHAVPS